MTPITREEIYLTKLAGGSVTVPTPVSRTEMYLAKACGETVTVPDPASREEMYLYKLAGGSIALPTPVSRLELLMAAACGEAVTPYVPVSRLEWFWSQLSAHTITGVPPLSFKSNGSPLISWSMLGNGQQAGTPTPDAPIMPTFCGTLDGTDWKIPITCAGQTVPVYLGQTQTVRRIKKLVLTGEEIILRDREREDSWRFFTDKLISAKGSTGICSHFENIGADGVKNSDNIGFSIFNNAQFGCRCPKSIANTTTDFKSYLAQQYAAGTPVTIWYVLAEPETAIVNEPLAKIGDYADELHSTDASVTIQTVSGSNTLTIDTTLQPSSVSITGNISQ